MWHRTASSVSLCDSFVLNSSVHSSSLPLPDLLCSLSCQRSTRLPSWEQRFLHLLRPPDTSASNWTGSGCVPSRASLTGSQFTVLEKKCWAKWTIPTNKKTLCTFPRRSDASSWIVQYVPVVASSQEKRLNLRREETINCLNGDRVEEPFIGRDCARAIKTPRRRVHSTGRRETFFSASINSDRRIRKYKIRRILLLWELRGRGRSDIIKKLPDKEPHKVQTLQPNYTNSQVTTLECEDLPSLSIFYHCHWVFLSFVSSRND